MYAIRSYYDFLADIMPASSNCKVCDNSLLSISGIAAKSMKGLIRGSWSNSENINPKSSQSVVIKLLSANPGNGKVVFGISNSVTLSPSTIKVCDISGRFLQSFTESNSTLNVDLSSYNFV